MKWILPISLLVLFEFVADLIAKRWSVGGSFPLAAGALLAYAIGNAFWLFALRNGAGLGRGAVVFSVVSAIGALFIGVVLYHEELTRSEIIGLFLGLISIGLIFWNE